MKMKSLLLTTAATIGLTAATMAQNVPSYVPTNGLVGWWPFNGNATDESGNGNNGTVNGATLTTDRFGSTDNAYSFNGTTDDITYQQLFPFHLSNNASLSIWLNGLMPPNGIQGTYLKSRLDQPDNNRFNLFLNPINQDLKLNVDYRESNFNIHILNIDTVPSGNWINFVLTRNDNTYSTYINGQLASTSIDNNPTLPNSIGWVLGNDPSSFSDYAGKIDDIGIWNRSLTQQEITDLYNGNICYQTITVTDTLLINMGIITYNPITYNNTIKIFPNPANNHITIDYGNYASLNGYQLQIENSLGQQLFQTNITQQSDYLSLNNWGGNGFYFVHIIDPQGNTIDIRKIVLQ
jgi:hypothetical protein